MVAKMKDTNQLHDGPYGTLYVDSVITINGYQARRTAKRGELDECGIVRHDGFEVVSTVCDHPVQLSGEDGGVTGNDGLALKRKELRIMEDGQGDKKGTLLTETWYNISLALCTPKNSPVIHMTSPLRKVFGLLREVLSSGPIRPCRGEGK